MRTQSRMMPRKTPRKVGMTTPQFESQSPCSPPAAAALSFLSPPSSPSAKIRWFLQVKVSHFWSNSKKVF